MPQDMSNINPDLLARLEHHKKGKFYQDIFGTQYQEKRKAQRASARIASKEPNIAIGVAGEMNIVSPGQLRQLRQRELQDVFGPQQSSQLSKKIKEDKLLGTQRARAQMEKIKAEQAAKQVTQPTTVSSSGATKTQSTLKSGKGVVTSEPIYINPVTRKRVEKPEFVGNRKGRLKVGQTREGSMDTLRKVGFEISIDGVPVRSSLYNPTIDAPKYEVYGSVSDGSMKKTGMSHGEAVDYISKRVRNDGGTVGNTRSLYGFDEQVKKFIDDGIVSQGDVIDILKGKNQANEFGRVLPRSSGAGIVSPPGQLTGMGNIIDLPKNAQRLITSLGLEDDMRLSYGEALLQSSRIDQQGGHLSTGRQTQIGGRANLADKQAMMVDHENLVKGHNAALKELYDADKQQKIAAGAKNRQDLIDLKEADKQQKLAADRLAKAEAKTAKKVQAVISQGSSEVGETILQSPFVPAAEQAEEVVRKAPISRRTMEKMMSSNMLAAGVAAGGLGLIYASNRMRGEREVGR
jgi:hypothetical protein